MLRNDARGDRAGTGESSGDKSRRPFTRMLTTIVSFALSEGRGAFDIPKAWKVQSFGELRGSSDNENATILVIGLLRGLYPFD